MAYEEREMFFEEKRNKNRRNKAAVLSNKVIPETSKAGQEEYMLKDKDDKNSKRNT